MIPDEQAIIDVARNLFWTCLMLSMPALATALVVGVVISLMQTVTSIQEQTLTFVPKLIAVLGMLMLTMPWIMGFITEYFEETLQMFSSFY